LGTASTTNASTPLCFPADNNYCTLLFVHGNLG
jgi:hypothetical protein